MAAGYHINNNIIPDKLGSTVMNVKADVFKKVVAENDIIIIGWLFVEHVKWSGDSALSCE